MGLIKFGSRVDVLLESSAELKVKVGDHVKGGSSILAHLAVAALRSRSDALPVAGTEPAEQEAR